MSSCGCYQLIINLKKKTDIKVGALGHLSFKRGFYIYTGRAAKNLNQRIDRHLRHDKKKRWHIDYLLVKGRVYDVLIYSGRLDECRINKEVYNRLNQAEIIRGFGSSDCRCPGHLIYTEDRPVYDPKDIPG